MSSTPFMPLWVADFVGDTLDLDAKEVGAYMLILMTMWGRDGYLPNDQKKLQRVARCGRDWPRVWAAIGHYFTEHGEQITQQRLRLELQKVATKREVNAQSGARGGAANALKYKGAVLANATVSLQQPEPEPKIEKEEGKPSSKKARASRLPDDWFLPRQWGEWAVAEGCSGDAVRSESEKFKDYWHSKAGPTASKLDWQATWRNWIRQAIERTPKLKAISGGRYEPSTASNFGSTSGRGDRPDPALEQIARITGLSAASGDGGFRAGGFGEKDGPLWMGTRPQ